VTSGTPASADNSRSMMALPAENAVRDAGRKHDQLDLATAELIHAPATVGMVAIAYSAPLHRLKLRKET